MLLPTLRFASPRTRSTRSLRLSRTVTAASSTSPVPPPNRIKSAPLLLPQVPHPIFRISSNFVKLASNVKSASASEKQNAGKNVTAKVAKKGVKVKKAATTKSLTYDEFHRLDPLDQIRRCLSLPVPTSLPKITRPELVKALQRRWPIEQETKEGEPLWDMRRLAFVGDRVWGQVVVEVLSLVVSDAVVIVGKETNLSAYGGRSSDLLANKLAAKLNEQLGIAQEVGNLSNKSRILADTWEGYLAALYLSNGRRALLEFLVPIVVAEYAKLPSPTSKAKKLDQGVMAIVPFRASMSLNDLENCLASLRKTVQKSKDSSLDMLKAPKPPPLSFASRQEAETKFLSTLAQKAIRHLYVVSSTEKRATLQLPGYPLFAAKTKAKTNPKKALLAQLVEGCRKAGFICLAPTKHELSAAKVPYVYESLNSASTKFFKAIATNQAKLTVENVGNAKNPHHRYRVRLKHHPVILGKPGLTRSERRINLIRAAIEAGAVRINPSPKAVSK